MTASFINMKGRVLRSGKEYEYFTLLRPVGEGWWAWPERAYSWLLQCYIRHPNRWTHTHNTNGHCYTNWQTHTHTHWQQWTDNTHKAMKINTQTTEKMNGHTHTRASLAHTHQTRPVVFQGLYSSILFSSYTRCQPVTHNNLLNTCTRHNYMTAERRDVGGDTVL